MSETLQRDVRSSVNEKDRSVEVCWTTGARVKRYSYEEGYYMEELQVDAKSIRLNRFNAMSLLDTHDSSSMESVLGTVVPGSVRFENGKAYARIKFSSKQRAEEVFQDIRDGHPLPISVGYKIHQYEKTEGADGQLPVLRAIDWEPLELSAVPIPADAGALSRNYEGKNMPHPSIRSRRLMTEPSQDVEETRHHEEAESQQDEIRNRSMTVREARGFATEFLRDTNNSHYSDDVQARIKRGMTEQDVRSTILEVIVARQERSPTFPHSELRDGGTNYQQQIELRQEAIAARMMGRPPEGNARHFMSASLIDHARGLLETQGVDTRSMSREQILGYRGRSMGGMHTTSDFPMLLQGAGNRVLMQAYQLAQSPLKTVLSRRSSANDFRAKSSLKISDGGLLTKVNEAGEIKSMTRAETAESYKIETYGRIFALSFQAIVNDDLGAFTDWSVQAGRMAALTENKILLDLLIDGNGVGPIMAEDNKRLFSVDHNNLATTGTELNEFELSAGILAFRKQTSLGGHRTNLAPRYILTGPELELTAQKLVASISPTTTSDAVPDAIRNLVPVVEPNLDGKSWYLFGDPAAAPVLEWSYLSGYEGPQIDSEDGFEILGTQFRAVLHFGGGAVDFRGAYRNPGTA